MPLLEMSSLLLWINSPIFRGGIAADIDELKDYEKIDYILSILVEDELSEIGVPMNKVKDVLMKYPEPRTLYNKVYDDLHAVVNNMAHRPAWLSLG